MTIGELCQILRRIEHLYSASGANAQAKDLKALAQCLSPHVNISVEAYVTDAKERLSRPQTKPKRAKTVAGSGKKAALDEAAVLNMIDNLQRAGTDPAAFEQAFNAVRTDKSLKLAEVAEIARRYAGTATSYKSKSAAQKDIAQEFIRQARFEEKIR